MPPVRLRRLLALLFAVLLLGLSIAPAALAQSGSATSSTPLGIGADAPGAGSGPAADPGAFGRLIAWVNSQQALLSRQLAAAVKTLKAEGTLKATLTLSLIGFLYGIFHAVGPGHGKAVISSYVLGNSRTLRRGIAIAWLAALIQALSAIVLVSTVFVLLRQLGLRIQTASSWLETVSYALIAGLGAWLLLAQIRRLRAGRTRGHAHGHDHGHVHDHAHAHDHAHGHGHTHAHGDMGDAHGGPAHVHGPDCDHGHAHLPEASALEGSWSWTKALGIAFAVGIRPCTGALLVLVFAAAQGLVWAGIWATFAMAIGTAIAVSVLASLAVGARDLAVRMSGKGSVWADRIETAAGLGAALLVLTLGVVFFLASLGPERPFV